MQKNWYCLLAAGLLGGSSSASCSLAEQDRDVDSYAETASSTHAPLYTAPAGARAIDNQYMVVFDDSASAATVRAAANRVALAGADGRVIHAYSIIPGFAAELTPRALEELRKDPSVAYIEQDLEVSIATEWDAPADGIDRVDQRKLPRDGVYNDYGRAGAGVHVYILDTGIRTTHTEFTDRVGKGFTAIDDGRGAEDCHGHGTHVASTAAGTRYGVAKQATVHPVRVLGCNGSGSTSGIIDALDFVSEECSQGGPCVANMSLGGSWSWSLNEAVANTVSSGVTVAVAAGNSDSDACYTSPASEPSAVTVAAVDDGDAKASFSNYGSCVDLYAPGVSILGASIGSDDDTATYSGTSMASPHTAGAAALFLGANPGATPAQVAAALEDAASVDCVSGNPGDTPNLLLFNGFGEPGFACERRDEHSCRRHCGGAVPGGACYCDFWCRWFEDCCPDYDDVCS